jgi:hypothetical protein
MRKLALWSSKPFLMGKYAIPNLKDASLKIQKKISVQKTDHPEIDFSEISKPSYHEK